MNVQRHLLPASIAAAIHTALLLGIPPGPPLGRDPDPMTPVTVFLHPTIVDLPAESDPADPPEPAARRPAPTNSAPDVPEPPTTPWKDDSLVEVRVDRVAPPGPQPTIPPGQPGPADGEPDGQGDRLKTPLIPASALDRMPRATVQIAPDYPETMRRAGIGGEVLVEFAIDTNGRVVTARVVRSAARDFEEPTLHAVRRWRFEPGRRQGRLVPFRLVVPVRFTPGAE